MFVHFRLVEFDILPPNIGLVEGSEGCRIAFSFGALRHISRRPSKHTLLLAIAILLKDSFMMIMRLLKNPYLGGWNVGGRVVE